MEIVDWEFFSQAFGECSNGLQQGVSKLFSTRATIVHFTNIHEPKNEQIKFKLINHFTLGFFGINI